MINLDNKKNKKTLILLLAFTIVLVISTIYGINKNNNKEDILNTTQYEILDENVITNDIMKRWVEENSIQKGVFTTSDEEYTYVLISYGITTKPNIGICLEEMSFNKKIDIKYSIISSESESEVEEYKPKMIIRFKGKDIKIKHGEINPS